MTNDILTLTPFYEQYKKLFKKDDKEVKQPTKIQIRKIIKKLISERVKLLKSCGLTKEEINNRISVLDAEYFITEGIIEWEKMNKTH